MTTRPSCFIVTLASLTIGIGSPLLADELQNASVVKIEQPTATSFGQSLAPQPDLRRGIMLQAGKTTVVLRLPSTQPISAISFANYGTKGLLNVFTSSVDLPANSKRWQQVGSNALTEGMVNAVVRPSEARYVKVSFDVTQTGEMSRFGVYAAKTVASKRAKDYALLAADETSSVESDGKSVVDGKDLGEAKDIPSEGEAPAEGPAPGLPAPPPFTFVPVLVPTSP